jgi:hypothetical protein
MQMHDKFMNQPCVSRAKETSILHNQAQNAKIHNYFKTFAPQALEFKLKMKEFDGYYDQMRKAKESMNQSLSS